MASIVLRESLLHVVVGESGAAMLREVLIAAGRRDEVACVRDDLAVGPIHDVDRGAARRAEWYRRAVARKARIEASAFDEVPTWKRIVRDERNVVIWHSPHPGEHICALRACWYLRQQPSRVYEVRLPRHPNPALPAFYGMIGVIGPERIAAAWPTVRRMRNVGAKAKEWLELRRQRGDRFRELRRGRVVELPISMHDAALVAACREGWTSSILVIARVISEVPTGDGILSWRVRELIQSGRLEARGE